MAKIQLSLRLAEVDADADAARSPALHDGGDAAPAGGAADPGAQTEAPAAVDSSGGAGAADAAAGRGSGDDTAATQQRRAPPGLEADGGVLRRRCPEMPWRIAALLCVPACLLSRTLEAHGHVCCSVSGP